MFSGRELTAGSPFFRAAAAASVLLLAMPFVIMFSSGAHGLVGVESAEPSVEGDADPYEHAWQFWWVSRALGSGTDPRFSPVIYAPEGASLAYDHVGWFDTLLFGLVGLGDAMPALAHSLSLLYGTVLTAFFGWLLARSWGAGAYGALFAALAMAWLPARTSHLLQHYQVANCWALPAAMWAVTLYLKDGRRRVLAVFGLFSLAGGLESPFISLFIAASLPAVRLVIGGSWRRTGLLALAWVLPTAALGLLAATAPGVTGALAPHWREAVYWAAEPLSFLLPSPFGVAAGVSGLPARLDWMPNAAEGVVTPGLTVLALFLIHIWRKRDWRLAVPVAGLWLLSLGPELKLLGRSTGIPLPFRLFQLLPVLEGVRAPSRFAIPAGMLVALAAGIAFSRSGARWKPVLFALLLLELGLPSLPVLPTRVPEACLQVDEGSTVLEVPVDPTVRRYSWFQTAGGYRRRYAFLARLPSMMDADSILEGSLEDENVTIMYHRWLYRPQDRIDLDRELAPVFPSGSPSDSVWVR